jgi:hypothetical protein
MEKCPILDGHQRKMCKSKVELPEAQALTVISSRTKLFSY